MFHHPRSAFLRGDGTARFVRKERWWERRKSPSAVRSDQQRQRNQYERDEREVRNRETEHSILDGTTAADRTRRGLDRHLHVGVIGGDGSSGDRQRQCSAIDAETVFERAYANDEDKRIHQDALIPAQFAGNQPEHLAEIQAPNGGDHGDCRAADKRYTAITQICSHDGLESDTQL